MRRLAFAVCGLILAHFGPVQAQEGWKPITAGGMTVSQPCSAEWDTVRREVPEEAAIVTAHMLVCKTSDTLFLLSWTDIETRNRIDGMTVLRSSRDAMLKEIGGALLMTSGDIEHDGLKGLEFTANLRDRLLLSGRAVFHEKKWYTVTIGTPIKQDRSADIKRFLTSFRIAK
jgi:hypothetical protein